MKKTILLTSAIIILLSLSSCGLKKTDKDDAVSINNDNKVINEENEIKDNQSDNMTEENTKEESSKAEPEYYSNNEILYFSTRIAGMHDGKVGDLKTDINNKIEEGEQLSCIYAKVIDTKYYIRDIEEENYNKYKNYVTNIKEYEKTEKANSEKLEKEVQDLHDFLNNTDYGIDEGARVYTLEITDVSKDYNCYNLKKGDIINAAIVSDEHDQNHIYLKDFLDYEDVINESEETITIGKYLYHRLQMNKKYKYEKVVTNISSIFLKDGEEYAFELLIPEEWKGQNCFSCNVCYPKENVENAKKYNEYSTQDYFWIYCSQLINIMENK